VAVIPPRGIAPVRPAYERQKRLLDLALALALLPVIAPIVGLCAVLIRLQDGGPVFFRQPRVGRGGRQFCMYKLRTMVPNAHELKAELLHLNEATGPDFKLVDDPRITPIGKYLRKGSIDELPQLWNVLRGDMSFVGPRPTSFSADTYDLWHTERLEVIPGITGLWQISKRGDTDFDERVRLDVAYIANRGMRLDLEILLRTVGAIALRRGAF
jgi:lipopolysaccharide/colanic/teichoic acid biosynthesis glycosyltransferase